MTYIIQNGGQHGLTIIVWLLFFFHLATIPGHLLRARWCQKAGVESTERQTENKTHLEETGEGDQETFEAKWDLTLTRLEDEEGV